MKMEECQDAVNNFTILDEVPQGGFGQTQGGQGFGQAVSQMANVIIDQGYKNESIQVKTDTFGAG